MQRECTIWCPECRKDKFHVLRKPTGANGVFEHELEAIDDTGDHKRCGCGANLERRSR